MPSAGEPPWLSQSKHETNDSTSLTDVIRRSLAFPSFSASFFRLLSRLSYRSFLSYATKPDILLYVIGLVGALGCGLPFAAIDLLYGHWTSGLLPRTGSGASPEDIRSVSSYVALIMVAVTVAMLLFSTAFFFCCKLDGISLTERLRVAAWHPSLF